MQQTVKTTDLWMTEDTLVDQSDRLLSYSSERREMSQRHILDCQLYSTVHRQQPDAKDVASNTPH